MIALNSGILVPDSLQDDMIQEAAWPAGPFAGVVDGYMPGYLGTNASSMLPSDDYAVGARSEEHLAYARNACRWIARKSPYARNGHENRINYSVHTGVPYVAVAKKGQEASEDLLKAVQEALDEFCYQNKWHKRQQETILRKDRDGEAFRRLFFPSGGMPKVRFVEPSSVSTTTDDGTKPNVRMGIESEPDDVETVVRYWIDGQPVPAAEVQHCKANVELNTIRGMPLFWPVIDTLCEVKGIRRNMGIGSKIQTSIAYVETTEGMTQAGAETARRNASGFTGSDPVSGKVTHYEPTRAGRILRRSGNTTIDAPFKGVNYATYVEVIADNLREVASLIQIPEFMLTSDASNANYSSTMVAEGPAVKAFKRLQSDLIQDDLEILWAVLRWLMSQGRLPGDTEELIEIQGNPPDVEARDLLQESQRRQLLSNSRLLSRQTWSGMENLDYEQEQTNIQADEEAYPSPDPLRLPEDEEDEDDTELTDDK